MVKAKAHLLKKYDLFIFDWDGTLNSLRFLMKMNENMKRMVGRWNIDTDIKNFNLSDHDLKRRLQLKEEENKLGARFLDAFLILFKPKLHVASISVLNKLKRAHKRMALLSNGRSFRLLAELRFLKIEDYFDAIVSAREVRAMKPNPSGIKAILYALGIKPGRTVYIGDAVDDIIAAKLSGVDSCAIACGFDSYHKLKSINPDYIFRSIEELKDSL